MKSKVYMASSASGGAGTELAPATNSMSLVARFGVFLRSAGVGIAATLFDLAALHALVQIAGLSARIASPPALLLGIGTQFVGNKLFAFGDRRPEWLRQGVQFLGVEALGLLANLLLFDCLVAQLKVPYLLARVFATSCVYFAICLPLWSRIFTRLGETAE